MQGWRVSVFLTLALSGVLAVSCTKRNPAVCCTTEADCAAVGLPLGSTCAEGSCVENACVDQACQAESDCPSGAPYCSAAGSCVQCLGVGQCGTLHCDEASNSCVECLSTADCVDGKVCDTAIHACTKCEASSECPSGICDLDTGRCVGTARITPKFTPTACDGTADTPLVLDGVVALDTDDPATCNSGYVGQLAGPQICIVHHSKITIAATAMVSSRGTRALALVSDGDLLILGVVDVGSTRTKNGPGGGFETDGVTTGRDGFGGAGFRTAGAAGGNDATDGGAANGGPARPARSTTGILVGGPGSAGVAGGGALSVVSCRGKVTVSGMISSSGAGGGAGTAMQPTRGGGGGGAGDYVILQGMEIEVTGRLFANGGSGGSGGPFNAVKGERGQDGLLSATMAALGGPATAGAGAGGNGGYVGGTPKVGHALLGTSSTSGGGGGSTGFLETATPAGRTPTITTIDLSPPFEANLTVSTH